MGGEGEPADDSAGGEDGAKDGAEDGAKDGAGDGDSNAAPPRLAAVLAGLIGGSAAARPACPTSVATRSAGAARPGRFIAATSARGRPAPTGRWGWCRR